VYKGGREGKSLGSVQERRRGPRGRSGGKRKQGKVAALSLWAPELRKAPNNQVAAAERNRKTPTIKCEAHCEGQKSFIYWRGGISRKIKQEEKSESPQTTNEKKKEIWLCKWGEATWAGTTRANYTPNTMCAEGGLLGWGKSREGRALEENHYICLGLARHAQPPKIRQGNQEVFVPCVTKRGKRKSRLAGESKRKFEEKNGSRETSKGPVYWVLKRTVKRRGNGKNCCLHGLLGKTQHKN